MWLSRLLVKVAKWHDVVGGGVLVTSGASCLRLTRNVSYLQISSAPMWNSRSVDVKPNITPFMERLQGSDTNCTR